MTDKTDSKSQFNSKRDEGGAFMPVEYRFGGAQIVKLMLWLNAATRLQIDEKWAELEKLSGKGLADALQKLGAFPRDAVQQGNAFVPLPDRKDGVDTRKDIDLNGIIPSEQRFDYETKTRFMVKYRDFRGDLDDPKWYVAAEQEIYLPEKTPQHFVHRDRGMKQDPQLRPGESRHRPAELWFNRDGAPGTAAHYERDVNKDIDGLPAWELLSEKTHTPAVVVHKNNRGIDTEVDYFDETTGDCLRALSIHDGKNEIVAAEDLKKIHAEPVISPSEPSVL